MVMTIEDTIYLLIIELITLRDWDQNVQMK